MTCRIMLLVFLSVAVAGCGEADNDRKKTPTDNGKADPPGKIETIGGTRAPPAGRKADPPGKVKTVREAAVAGLFYPGDKDNLSKLLDGLLAQAPEASPKHLRGLICPHAGYRYSGRTAAIGYKRAAGGLFHTVIVLAPSHYAQFEGASVSTAGAYRTPLGLIPVSRKAAGLAAAAPFVSSPRADVRRPPWSRQSPKKPPPYGKDTPHTWEHSLEVQLPLLQKVLAKFTLVPVVLGRVDAKAAARTLGRFVDDKTLVVASSDLSHYRPYEEARMLDRATIATILRMDAEMLRGSDACGYLPIKTLLYLARARRWKPRLLDYRNSGDTAGDKSRVVGYAAIAFYDADAPAPAASTRPATRPAPVYSPEHRRFLLGLARKTLAKVVQTGAAAGAEAAGVPKALVEKKACFVTLTKGGQLRGCVGGFFPRDPLFKAVADMTYLAAMKDTRFKPVTKGELDDIDLEISVLTVPRPLTYDSPEDLLAILRPNIDGVILRLGRRQSTYLPQVWKQIPDKETFLGNLSRKAGLSASAWRRSGVTILTYQVEAFHERERKNH